MHDRLHVHKIGMTLRILIWQLAGRSAKPPNLIPHQIFWLYGIMLQILLVMVLHNEQLTLIIMKQGYHCYDLHIFVTV